MPRLGRIIRQEHYWEAVGARASRWSKKENFTVQVQWRRVLTMVETQAYFSGIRDVIVQRLDAAKESVLVAVAWLTDRVLFEALVSCQRRGVAVSLAVLDDRINRQSSIAWERLTALGGRFCWIPEGTARAGSLHHKFCLIDNDTVINGSFNWTNRASSADENIIGWRQLPWPVDDNYPGRITPVPGRWGRRVYGEPIVIQRRLAFCPARRSRTTKCKSTSNTT